MDPRKIAGEIFRSFSRFLLFVLVVCAGIAGFGCYLMYHQLSLGADPGPSSFSFQLPGGGSFSMETGSIGLILVALSLALMFVILKRWPRFEMVGKDGDKYTFTHNRSLDGLGDADEKKLRRIDPDKLKDLDEDDFRK